MRDQPRVIVCQHGARRRYAVPRLLEKAGMLEALYTDSSEYSVLGRIAGKVGRAPKGRLRRLLGRTLYGISQEKVFSTDKPFMAGIAFALLRKNEQSIFSNHRKHAILSKAMTKWGLRNANIIYSMYHESLDFLDHAKSCGRKIVVDVFASPLSDRIHNAECIRFPELGEPVENSAIEFSDRLISKALNIADILFCPSQWVIDALQDSSRINKDKIVLLPYGNSIDYGGRTNQPIEGRILFAGNSVLGKGLPYLAEASEMLRSCYPHLDFRIAGSFNEMVRNHALLRNLNFLGPLTRTQLEEEYLAADLFVLPTLSEGLSAAILEAMAAGVPVITTRCSGVALQNGQDGIIVPERNGTAISIAIESLLLDREKRKTLARRARERASFYSLENYGKRLTETLQRSL